MIRWIIVVFLALVIGATLRRLHHPSGQARGVVPMLVQSIERIYQWLVRILEWIIVLVPLAVFGATSVNQIAVSAASI